MKKEETPKNVFEKKNAIKKAFAGIGVAALLSLGVIACNKYNEKRAENIYTPSLEDLIGDVEDEEQIVVVDEQPVEEEIEEFAEEKEELEEEIESDHPFDAIDLSNYEGYSLDEALKSIGLEPTPELKAELAAYLEIDPYLKTAEQNIRILQSLGATIKVGGVEKEAIKNENGEFVVVPIDEEKKKQEGNGVDSDNRQNEGASNETTTPENQGPENNSETANRDSNSSSDSSDSSSNNGSDDEFDNNNGNTNTGNNQGTDNPGNNNNDNNNGNTNTDNNQGTDNPGNNDNNDNTEEEIKTYVELYHKWVDNQDGTCSLESIQQCNEDGSIKTVIIKTQAHAMGEWITNEAGTEKTRKCENDCGYKEIEEIKKPEPVQHEHNYVSVPGSQRYVNNGDGTHSLVENQECNVEGCPEDEKIKTDVELSRENHTMGEWVTNEAGTEKERKCTAEGCGYKETEEIKKPEPVQHEHNYVSVPGSQRYVNNGDGTHSLVENQECNVEGCPEDEKIKTDVELSRENHTMGEWVTNEAGTEKERKCTAEGCGYKETEEIKKPEHSHIYVDVEGTGHYVDNGDGTHSWVVDQVCNEAGCPEDEKSKKDVVVSTDAHTPTDINQANGKYKDVWCPTCGTYLEYDVPVSSVTATVHEEGHVDPVQESKFNDAYLEAIIEENNVAEDNYDYPVSEDMMHYDSEEQPLNNDYPVSGDGDTPENEEELILGRRLTPKSYYRA